MMAPTCVRCPPLVQSIGAGVEEQTQWLGSSPGGCRKGRGCPEDGDKYGPANT